jgi:hypothetical protein
MARRRAHPRQLSDRPAGGGGGGGGPPHPQKRERRGGRATKMADPATTTRAPRATRSAALSALIPPSTSSSARAPTRSSRARARATLSSVSGMRGWPPKPGFTVMTSSRSSWVRISSTTTSGVAGQSAAPARTPASWIAAIVPWRWRTASTWTVMMVAPASTNSRRKRRGSSIIRWTSSGRPVERRITSTIDGPIEILGTNAPSMMSTWM